MPGYGHRRCSVWTSLALACLLVVQGIAGAAIYGASAASQSETGWHCRPAGQGDAPAQPQDGRRSDTCCILCGLILGAALPPPKPAEVLLVGFIQASCATHGSEAACLPRLEPGRGSGPRAPPA